MNTIDYDYLKNHHTTFGTVAALTRLFALQKPGSLLDVGCGPGVWSKAAMELGVPEVWAIDGNELPGAGLTFPSGRFRRVDLTQPWDMGRSFEMALCLEVAEHLASEIAPHLVASLCRHADTIVFSAACPGQYGQHHVNCQWPAYWQELFNREGFSCDDRIRWQLWDNAEIEPWYRQNMFVARRNPGDAGREPRIRAVIHPEMAPWIKGSGGHRFIARGGMPLHWYLLLPFRAIGCKAMRGLKRWGGGGKGGAMSRRPFDAGGPPQT